MVAVALRPLIAPTIAVPPSPAEISPDTSLADLLNIKHEWLRLAKETGYADMCWEVLQWLGVSVKACAGHDPVLVCRLPNGVALVGGERTEKRIVRSRDESQNAWLTKRSLTVWLESQSAEYRGLAPKARERGNVVDEITFSSVPVARLYWEYPGDEQPCIQEKDSFFLPGAWFNTILSALPDAKQKAQSSGAEARENERLAVMSSLLVGQQI